MKEEIMNRKTSLLALITVLSALTVSSALADIIYVKADGTGDYPTIQAAIDAATDGDEVVLESGTYTGDGNLNIDFLGKAITVGSTNPEDPNVVATTIMDCQNSRRGFYFHTGENTDSVVMGLTITNGNGYAMGDVPPEINGGGILCHGGSPTIRNCVITNNQGEGGGVCIDGGSTTISNCTISNNYGYGGCGIECNGSSPTIMNCRISNNTTEYAGGGIRCSYSSPTITNCTISGNSGGYYGGGGIYCFASTANVRNCILWGNTASIGSQINLSSPSSGQPPADMTVEYCDVQGGLAEVSVESGCTLSWGEGNIDDNPQFANPANEDYHSLADSPCIDAGNNLVVDANYPDLDGNPRLMDGDGDGMVVVDMGAYEFFYPNRSPIAEAGPDQVLFTCAGGMAEVKLDGSGSYDNDGDELEYFWFEGDEQIATGVDPNVELGVGEHIIELIVDDGTDSSEPNKVVITVIGLIEADVHIVPRVINRRSRRGRIFAIMRLPEGIDRHDVSDEAFVLEPGGIEAVWQRVTGWGDRAMVFMSFDKDEVMDELPDYGRVESTVIGKLESGQCIYGRDTVRIIRPRQRSRLRIRR
jgi:hypothetical protein